MDDANRNGVPQLNSNSLHPSIELDRVPEKVDIIETTSSINEQIDTNEIDLPPPAEATVVISNGDAIAVDQNSCNVNNGGCEQICNNVPNAENSGTVVECSCYEGFYLDKEGGTVCLGKLFVCFVISSIFYALAKKNTHRGHFPWQIFRFGNSFNEAWCLISY